MDWHSLAASANSAQVGAPSLTVKRPCGKRRRNPRRSRPRPGPGPTRRRAGQTSLRFFNSSRMAFSSIFLVFGWVSALALTHLTSSPTDSLPLIWL